MKILYVVSRPLEINTSASIRNRATIIGLLKNGHDVDLVTTEPDKNHNAYDQSLIPEGIGVKYVKLSGVQSVARVGRKFSFLKPVKQFVYDFMTSHEIYDNLKGIINFAGEISQVLYKYDIIISSSDPKSSHLFVYEMLKANKEFRGKWIQIWGDPFLNDITLSKKANKERIASEEKKLLSLADRVVYVSEMTLEQQKKIYIKYRDKMIYLPIPYMEELLYPLQDLSKKETINLVYCGDYNPSVRNIKPLYETINKVSGFHLTICGNSTEPVQSSDNVTVYKRIPYKEVVDLEENADILVHISNLCGTQIPGKIYQYSGTNKPVLFILDGEKEKIRKQFEKYNRYIFADNKLSEIEYALESIVNSKRLYSSVKDFSKERVCKLLLMDISHG